MTKEHFCCKSTGLEKSVNVDSMLNVAFSKNAFRQQINNTDPNSQSAKWRIHRAIHITPWKLSHHRRHKLRWAYTHPQHTKDTATLNYHSYGVEAAVGPGTALLLVLVLLSASNLAKMSMCQTTTRKRLAKILITHSHLYLHLPINTMTQLASALSALCVRVYSFVLEKTKLFRSEPPTKYTQTKQPIDVCPSSPLINTVAISSVAVGRPIVVGCNLQECDLSFALCWWSRTQKKAAIRSPYSLIPFLLLIPVAVYVTTAA